MDDIRSHQSGLQAKNWLIFTLTTSLALLLSAVTLNSTTLASSSQTSNVEVAPIVKAESAAVFDALPEVLSQDEAKEPIVTVEQYVKTYFTKTPILAKISKCESQYRQFANGGNVLRGREVQEDVGVMQINETYHKATAEKLGYDIYTLDGNLAYAQYLYDRQGTQPWSASQACWNR